MPLEIHARVGPDQILLQPEDWAWTGQRFGDALVKPGDVIYVHLADGMEGKARRATLEQDSGAEGSLMAIDNTTGDVLAMVGGRDYALSQFNRATQAERQTGSSFKPYVYTAAIEDGAKPSDIIVDGPVNFGGYTPHNYENDYKGSMTLLNAFAESRNIPALKLAARVGIHKVIDMAHRFGVTSNIPAYLPIAIGAVEITLQEQVASYSVFPNDGLRVAPRLIRKVTNADGMTLWEDNPEVSEVIDQQTARTMMIFLQAVTQHGTGAAAAQLKHPLGGKTGTTSDYTDAWFLGFSPSVTCGVWVGYDSRQSLGEKETGAKAALPIWMAVMKVAIAGKDDEQFIGDQEAPSSQKNPPLQAAALPPAKPASANAVAKLANASGAAKPASASAAPKPPSPSVATGAGAKPLVPAAKPAGTGMGVQPTVRLIAKPSPQPPANSPSVKPQVKPALPPPLAPAKPAAKPSPQPSAANSPVRPASPAP
jgi:penicillin-binding protein 1A